MFHNADFTEETYPKDLNKCVADVYDNSICSLFTMDEEDGVSSWDSPSSNDLLSNNTPSPMPNSYDMFTSMSDQRSDD